MSIGRNASDLGDSEIWSLASLDQDPKYLEPEKFAAELVKDSGGCSVGVGDAAALG
jgi:hypothetical protein